jgi:ribonuclease T1
VPSTRNRPALLAVLAVAVLVLAWLLVRAAGGSGPDAGQPDARPGAVASSTAPTSAAPTRSTTTRGTGPATTTPRGGGGATDPASGLPWIAESALPAQARQTLALIRAGGPYPYPRNDDKTFGNRERLLPREPSGYYREYTVITPGEGDRGARRIITGREGEKYWTADHYDSFSRIREGS